ncbi:MAG: hypothetical protein NVS3B26_28230 [Mycobacteriales bacterium]
MAPPLVTILECLHAATAADLDVEKHTLLPVAARHLSAEEWNRAGAAAVAGIPRSRLPLVCGMLAYDADPEVLRFMLSTAAPIARTLLPRVASAAYRRHARRIYETSMP